LFYGRHFFDVFPLFLYERCKRVLFVMKNFPYILVLCVVVAGLSACSRGEVKGPSLSKRVVNIGQKVPKGGGHYKVGKPYQIAGQWFYPKEDPNYDKQGVGSWYGDMFHGRYTANGEVFDMNALTAAHPTLPLPSYVRVTNMKNNNSLVVRVNDRGPYKHGRIIDLSKRSAEILGYGKQGTAPVRVTYLGRAPLNGDDSYERGVLASKNFGTSENNIKSAEKSSPHKKWLWSWRAKPLALGRLPDNGKQ
jgi:rare lipoprotein A (peptidoglycan hydrolase)